MKVELENLGSGRVAATCTEMEEYNIKDIIQAATTSKVAGKALEVHDGRDGLVQEYHAWAALADETRQSKVVVYGTPQELGALLEYAGEYQGITITDIAKLTAQLSEWGVEK